MIGKTLSRYHILEQIGAGGMGTVYRARDERLARDVALKVLPAGTLADDAARQRFRQEALALSQLNHPNIATVHDFDSHEGTDFLVMEYIPGVTLDDQLNGGPLTEKQVIRFGIQFAQGLAAAHEQGVIHRDLKPGNLRITPDGRLKILDFGLARFFQPASDLSLTRSSGGLSGPVGTLPYMAPEQLRDEKADSRTDLYSMGAVLYEMATGQRPFPETHGARLVDSILHDRPAEPRVVNRRVSPALEQIIIKALDKNPDLRYQTARDLQADLDRLRLFTETGTAFHPRPAPRRLTPARIASAALAIVLLAVAGYWGWQRLDPQNQAVLDAQAIRSMTILPFRNIGGTTEYDYFGVGMAEVLSAKLTNARFLELRAPRTADRADPNADPVEVGRKLGVDAVLTGSYQIQQGSLSLSYTLIDVRSNTQLSGDALQEDFTNVVQVEHRLAEGIVNSLKSSVSLEERAQLAAVPTQKNEAFQAYLQSNYEMDLFWREPSARQLSRVQMRLEEALRLDPDFALAHVSLARLHWMAVYWGYADAQRSLDAAEKQADLAIARDPSYGEAYAARALVAFQRGQMEKFRQSLRDAFARSPNSPLAYYAAGYYFLARGLADRSVFALRRAQELNSQLVRREIGVAYQLNADFARARDEFRRALQLYPGDRTTTAALMNALIALGDLKGAGELEPLLTQGGGDDPIAQALVALLRVREGKPFAIDSWVNTYRDAYWSDGGYAAQVASVYAVAKRPAEAMRWLRRSGQLSLKSYPFIAQNLAFDNLRSNPEFQSYLGALKAEWETEKRREAQDPLIPGNEFLFR